MRRRRIALVAAAMVVVALTFVWRWFETVEVGTGETRTSPDGRFTASAMDVSGRRFVSGAPWRRFRFRVVGPGFDVDLDTAPLPGPDFGSRSSHSVVRWAADSSEVRFVFPSAEFRIATRPAGG